MSSKNLAFWANKFLATHANLLSRSTERMQKGAIKTMSQDLVAMEQRINPAEARERGRDTLYQDTGTAGPSLEWRLQLSHQRRAGLWLLP